MSRSQKTQHFHISDVIALCEGTSYFSLKNRTPLLTGETADEEFDGQKNVISLAEYMTTEQLTPLAFDRVFDACREDLRKNHPFLEDITVPAIDEYAIIHEIVADGENQLAIVKEFNSELARLPLNTEALKHERGTDFLTARPAWTRGFLLAWVNNNDEEMHRLTHMMGECIESNGEKSSFEVAREIVGEFRHQLQGYQLQRIEELLTPWYKELYERHASELEGEYLAIKPLAVYKHLSPDEDLKRIRGSNSSQIVFGVDNETGTAFQSFIPIVRLEDAQNIANAFPDSKDKQIIAQSLLTIAEADDLFVQASNIYQGRDGYINITIPGYSDDVDIMDKMATTFSRHLEAIGCHEAIDMVYQDGYTVAINVDEIAKNAHFPDEKGGAHSGTEALKHYAKAITESPQIFPSNLDEYLEKLDNSAEKVAVYHPEPDETAVQSLSRIDRLSNCSNRPISVTLNGNTYTATKDTNQIDLVRDYSRDALQPPSSDVADMRDIKPSTSPNQQNKHKS